MRFFSNLLVFVTVLFSVSVFAQNLRTVKSATVSTSVELVVWSATGLDTSSLSTVGKMNESRKCSLDFNATTSRLQFRKIAAEPKQDGFVYTVSPSEVVTLNLQKIAYGVTPVIYNACGSEPEDCTPQEMKQASAQLSFSDKDGNRWVLLCNSDLVDMAQPDPVLNLNDVVIPGLTLSK